MAPRQPQYEYALNLKVSLIWYKRMGFYKTNKTVSGPL